VSVRYQHALKQPRKSWRGNRAQSAPTYALHFITWLRAAFIYGVAGRESLH
jgi:hypothetical protein